MEISVRSNIDAVLRTVKGVEKQIPFATALALTDTAKDVQKAVTADLEKKLDRPTPFTKRAYTVKAARKTDLRASVFAKDIQAKYLSTLEKGGERRPAKRALTIPRETRLNAYGNMPKGALKRMLARKDTFSGRVGGVGGIWQRRKDGQLVLLVAFEPRARYKPQLGFGERARKVALDRAGPNMRTALQKAVRSAK